MLEILCLGNVALFLLAEKESPLKTCRYLFFLLFFVCFCFAICPGGSVLPVHTCEVLCIFTCGYRVKDCL